MRDPWSDLFAASQPQHRFELLLRRFVERWALSRAVAVTTTTVAVANLLADRYQNLSGKIEVVRNGYDSVITAPLLETGHRLSMLFAGELYVGRDPFPLLAGVEWLLQQPEVDPSRIEVVFMGKVAAYGGRTLQGWLSGKRCSSVVKIIPPQTSDSVTAAIRHATLLINLAQRQPMAVPAKTYEQLASGREILLICEPDCETARVVAGVHGVVQVDPDNSEQMNAAMLDLYRRHVTEGTLTTPSSDELTPYSRAAANETFAGLLRSLSQSSVGLNKTGHGSNGSLSG
jgi:hypothetical protein